MPTNKELSTMHRTVLFRLLKMRKEHPEIADIKGLDKGLDDFILEMIAVMDAEDVAYVREQVELVKKQ